MDAVTTQTCRVTSAGRHSAAHGGGAGCWSRSPAVPEAYGRAVWGGSSLGPLSAETHRQAVPRVCVLFPPPASAVVLVVSSVANWRPHGSAAHGAVATTLGVVMGAFHRQFHATVLVIQMRTRQCIWGCRGDGWGSHMVNSLQRWGSFNTSLSARDGGYSKGRWGDSKPGLIVRCHDQCPGSSRLRFAAGHWQGCGQAGH